MILNQTLNQDGHCKAFFKTTFFILLEVVQM